MSTHVAHMVHDRAGGTVNEKMVLLELANWSDHEGRNIYPSVANVASVCLLSERTVQRILRRFERWGLIELEDEARQHKARVCRIDLAALRALPPYPSAGAS